MKKISLILAAFTGICCCCRMAAKDKHISTPAAAEKNTAIISNTAFDSGIRTIHVLVALCDNKYQGIVPVPAAIGNGQDPAHNLYWGCAYGVSTWFKKSAEWKLVSSRNIDSIKMERLVFKNNSSSWYLVADAYNGKFMKDCVTDYLNACAGIAKDTVMVNGKRIGIAGNAKLLAFIGHDGLMDFSLDQHFDNADGQQRDAVILACISKKYFSPLLQQTKANPLVWSTGLMSPEAYTLHDAVSSYINHENAAAIRNNAAAAYAKYQHCSVKAAMGLLVTGW